MMIVELLNIEHLDEIMYVESFDDSDYTYQIPTVFSQVPVKGYGQPVWFLNRINLPESAMSKYHLTFNIDDRTYMFEFKEYYKIDNVIVARVYGCIMGGSYDTRLFLKI